MGKLRGLSSLNSQPSLISLRRARNGFTRSSTTATAQLVIESGDVRAYTRNGFEWSERYPGIVRAAAKLDCQSAILDGEVIVQDERGISDIEALRSAFGGNPTD